jgi:hypothetical protein
MSSYGSNKSGYLHPQYQQQQQQPEPPYPTTPGAGPPSQQPNYFPPIPEQQAMYSTSPTSPRGIKIPQAASSRNRRTSSSSSYNSQRPSQIYPGTHIHPGAMPIPIRQPQYQYQQTPSSYPPQHQQQPLYAHSPSSQQSQHSSPYSEHHHHQHEQDHEQQYYYALDPETERSYERRYARDKAFERRPTLGGSLLSMVGKVGRAFGGTDRR